MLNVIEAFNEAERYANENSTTKMQNSWAWQGEFYSRMLQLVNEALREQAREVSKR